MKPRDFLGQVDRLTIRSTPYCLPFEFLPPPEAILDRIPLSAIGVLWKRCYAPDLPQIGWVVEHAGHLWRVVEVRQPLATKGSRDQDYLPIRICRYLEAIEK